jgi:hypothetical protein
VIDPENVCRHLIKGSRCWQSIDVKIDYAARDFWALDLAEVKALNISIIERIVGSLWLCLNEEDSLLAFISTLDCDFSRFCFVRSESIPAFLGLLSPSSLDPLIWLSLCSRLLCRVLHAESAISGVAASRFVNPDLALGLRKEASDMVEFLWHELFN